MVYEGESFRNYPPVSEREMGFSHNTDSFLVLLVVFLQCVLIKVELRLALLSALALGCEVRNACLSPFMLTMHLN